MEKINSEEKYRTILENANDLIGVYNEKFECEYVNEKVLKEILGYTYEEIKGKNLIKTIHPEDRASSINIFNNTFKVGQGIGQVRIKHKSGYYKWFESKGKIFTDQNGKRNVIIISRDITERKKVEIALKESENLYKTLIKTSPDGIIIIDGKSKVIDISKQALSLSGFENAKEIIGKSFFDFIYPKDRKRAIENLRKTLMVDGLRNEKYKFLKKDGTYYIGELNASLIKSIYGHEKIIVSIVRDITKREQAEKKLQESEEQYRNLYEKALVGLWTVRIDDGAIISANNETVRITGVKSVENLINNFTIADFIDKELRQELVKRLKKFGEICDYKAHLRDINGLEKDVSITAKLNYDKRYVEGYFIDITDLKKIKKALQESEEKYSSLFQQSIDAIFIYDLEGNIIDINKKALNLFDYSRQEILSLKIHELHPIEESEKLKEAFQKIVDKGKARFEISFKKKSDEIFPAKVSSSLLEIGGKVVIRGIVHDITKRKQAELKLKGSEEKYRTLFESSIDGIAFCDIKGNFIDINKQFLDMLGYSKKEIKKITYQELTPPKWREMEDNFNNLLLLGKKSYAYEKEFIRKDGTIFPISVRAWLLKNDKGKADGMWAIVRDITERKKVEEKLKESEKKYREIIENTLEGYFEVDLEGNITFFNDALCKLLGFSSEELIQMNYKNIMSEESSKRTFKIFKSVYNTEITHKNYQYELIRKDGKNIYGETSVYLRYNSNGDKIGFSGFLRDITEKKEAEEKYRNMINDLDLGFLQVKWDGTILNANPAFCKIMGYAHPENLNNVNVRIFWKNPEELKKFTKELLEKNIVENYVIHSKDKNGAELILQTNSHLIRNNAGKPIKIEGTIANITEKFKLEQKLKNSEERYRQLFENTPFSINLIDQHGTVIDFNPASEKLTGYMREELIGRNFNILSMIHQKYISIILKRLENVRKGEILNPIDIQLYKKDGGLIWIKYQSSLVKIGNETLIQIIFHDISEQKKVEQKLIESEEKFRRIFRAIPDMFFLVSGDSTILDYRGKEEDLYMTPEAFLGRKLKDILPNHLGVRSSNAIKRTIDTQRPTLIEYSLPIRGKTRYFEARNLYFANNQVAIFVREISERKNAEFLIKKEVEKLKELDQIRKDLISRVSHELKTPLIPICGGAELLLLSYKAQLGREAKEIIKMIEKGGKRLENLVENLLEITRIEYNKLELEKGKSDLSDLIRNCSNEMKYLIKERKITLNLDLPNKLYIDIDCMRIEQVITNLLTNAIKNTPPKGKITIILEKIDNWVKITVSDTGVGLNQEEMERLFTRFGKIERYEQGLEYIDIQGSGLGLFISKEIVNLHGGHIWAESQGRNKGSNFIVKIPINLENI